MTQTRIKFEIDRKHRNALEGKAKSSLQYIEPKKVLEEKPKGYLDHSEHGNALEGRPQATPSTSTTAQTDDDDIKRVKCEPCGN